MDAIKPGYKSTEIGVIPVDWEVKRLEELGIWKGGGTPSMSNASYWYNGNIPWASSGDIKVRRLSGTANCITERAVKESNTTLLVEGAILIVTRSGILRKYLPVALNTVPVAINQDIKALIPNNKILNEYLLQVLLERGRTILSTCIKSGTTVESIEYSLLKKFQVPVPPLHEQHAIAEVLSDIDAEIAALDALIAKKRDMKLGAMQELLTSKKRLPGFSDEWEVKRLGDIADVDLENLGSNTNPNYAFKYISLDDVDNGVLRSYTDQTFRTSPSRARRIVRQNDILISTVRPNLKSHLFIKEIITDTVCSTGFSVLRCKKGVAYPAYVYFHLFANFVEKQIESLLTGSSYPAINSSDVKALQIPLPNDENEQIAIANVLSDMDAEISALETQHSKTIALKQGMMQELLTGKTRLI